MRSLLCGGRGRADRRATLARGGATGKRHVRGRRVAETTGGARSTGSARIGGSGGCRRRPAGSTAVDRALNGRLSRDSRQSPGARPGRRQAHRRPPDATRGGVRGGGGRGGGVLAAAAGASTQKFGGEDATRQMGALIALMMAGSSSPMMAAETYDATTRELIRNADKIQARYGVNVMSTTEEGQLRSDIVEAILEIGKKASAPGGGGEAGLLEVLPAEGIRGVAMALDPAWRDAIRKILAVQASTADMFRDAQFMAQSPETQQQSMQQQIEGRMDELMLGPLSKVMSAAQTAVPAAIAAGEIGFGAYIVGKGLGGLYRGVRSVLGRFGVGRGVAGAAGGLGGAMGSVATMRVGVMYVGSVMPGGPGGRGRGGLVRWSRSAVGPHPARARSSACRPAPGSGASSAGSVPGSASLARSAERAVQSASTGGRCPTWAPAWARLLALWQGDRRLAAGRAGGVLGGLGGAAAGAALGSLILPVVGTAIGGLFGYYLGDRLGADGRGPGRGRGGGRGGRGGGAPAASTAVSRGHDDQRQLAG